MTMSPGRLAPLEAPTLGTSPTRKLLGVVVFALAGVIIVLFGIGTWNPWRNVLLMEWFADPFLGLLLLSVAVLIGFWLILPIRSGAVQRNRAIPRVVAVVFAFIGLMGYGLYGVHLIYYDGTELVRSPEGDFAIARVEATGQVDSEIHLLKGEGVATTDQGWLAPDCASSDEWTFLDNDTVQVVNNYGTFVIDLDPDSGQPLTPLGPCDALV